MGGKNLTNKPSNADVGVYSITTSIRQTDGLLANRTHTQDDLDPPRWGSSDQTHQVHPSRLKVKNDVWKCMIMLLGFSSSINGRTYIKHREDTKTWKMNMSKLIFLSEECLCGGEEQEEEWTELLVKRTKITVRAGFNQGERVCPSAPQWLSLENKAGFRTNTAAS